MFLSTFGPGACASGTGDSDEASGFGAGPGPQASQASQGGEGVTGGDTTGGGETFGPTTVPEETATSADPTVPMFECGNGVLDPNEECDGVELDAQSCDSFGFEGGTLLCSAQCSYDTSMCDAAAVCGDGLKVESEACDCGVGPCSAAQLGNVSCTALASPNGPMYSGGVLACTAASCTLDVAGCTYCGDGTRNGLEPCEGVDLGGQSCTTQGFDSGNLSCAVDCSFNTKGCNKITCGDGLCQGPVEDDCTCPADCPNNPNECSECECGGMGGPLCGCDALCLVFGDCCFGGPC